MHRDLIKLGEAATYINGYAFKPDDRGKVGLPIIRIQDLTGNSYDLGFYDGDYPEKIEINDGDVLISWSASLGVYIWNNGKALLNQHIFKVVFDKVNIDKNYFVYAVRYKLDEMGRKTHGATMKHIVKRDFDATEIPYPSKHEQIEIANNLKRIENIIELRSNELQLLDELIKARFVEMFGDCSNMVLLNDLCLIITDGTHQPPKFQEKGIPFILVSNLSNNTVTYNTEKYISEETYNELYKRTPIEPGDLLLSTVGSYGHPAVVTEDIRFLFQRHIAYLRPKRELVNSFYLHSALLAPDGQRQIEEKVKGIAQKTLNLSEIRKIMIPLPKMEEQDKFAAFVHQVDKSKLLSLIKLLEQLITYLYNVFIIYRQDKGEEVERHE
ncbi:restriction endonuclease subunit S [Coprococcus sp. RTP31081st1_D2_RTP31081_211007]|jgi:type I restriction enzyme S subunit|uniref:restriction endonuclease subunit S n=1 Tax=unclassified Coprococcus TaxID=2684943 RepID=UPI0032ED68BE